jgi:type II secretory ATPase GspE/PulE/Tfp pilus assembly ATPase PilB-like protein
MYIGEQNMICKTCKKDKCKEPVIRGDVTRFIDESGQLWNGKVCPNCYKTYNKERMRKLRASKKVENALKT